MANTIYAVDITSQEFDGWVNEPWVGDPRITEKTFVVFPIGRGSFNLHLRPREYRFQQASEMTLSGMYADIQEALDYIGRHIGKEVKVIGQFRS